MRFGGLDDFFLYDFSFLIPKEHGAHILEVLDTPFVELHFGSMGFIIFWISSYNYYIPKKDIWVLQLHCPGFRLADGRKSYKILHWTGCRQ